MSQGIRRRQTGKKRARVEKEIAGCVGPFELLLSPRRLPPVSCIVLADDVYTYSVSESRLRSADRAAMSIPHPWPKEIRKLYSCPVRSHITTWWLGLVQLNYALAFY